MYIYIYIRIHNSILLFQGSPVFACVKFCCFGDLPCARVLESVVSGISRVRVC